MYLCFVFLKGPSINCINILAPPQLILKSSFGFRLETLQRSLEWARGRLITVPAADYIAEVTDIDYVYMDINNPILIRLRQYSD